MEGQNSDGGSGEEQPEIEQPEESAEPTTESENQSAAAPEETHSEVEHIGSGEPEPKPAPAHKELASASSETEHSPHSTETFAKHASAYQSNKSSNKGLKVLVVVLVVLLVAVVAGAYVLIKKKNPSTNSSQTSSSASQTPAKPTGTRYVSNGKDLNLVFYYPKNWTVSPPTNSNSGDQTITTSSPTASISPATGSAVNGKVVVTFRPASEGLSELNGGNGVAAEDSTQIGYIDPAPGQHTYPYITFINLVGDHNGFSEVLVTGVTKFKKGEQVNVASLTGLDPEIAANFYQCSTTDCTGAGAKTINISQDTWNNNALAKQALGVFQSVQIH